MINKEILDIYNSSLYILSKKDIPGIRTNKKIALYDSVEKVFKGFDLSSTSGVLEKVGVNYTLIKDFQTLKDFDVLIIGCNSVDNNISKGSIEIRRWLENGGKIVCFEQSMIGSIPFLGEINYEPSHPMYFVDLIDDKNPVLASINCPEYWDGWMGDGDKISSEQKKIFNTYIKPINESVIAAGGLGRAINIFDPAKFGMVICEMKVGKGIVFFSQPIATGRYGKDSIATKYINNVLEYTLGEGQKLESIYELQGRKLLDIDPKQCFYVDISPYANRTFKDDVSDDQLGGWTDQGNNDFSGVAKGEVVFFGIPYKIIDDTNDKKSCMLLYGEPRPYFPKEIKGIEVKSKAKKLFFLQATAYGTNNNPKIGKYVIHYADGTTKEADLILGKNIGNWWNPTDLPEAWVSLKYINPFGALVGLYTYIWENPYPDKEITKLDFISAQKKPIPICVAITGMK